MVDYTWMGVETSVGDCCGLHAIYNLSSSLKAFKETLLDSRNEFPYENEDDDSYSKNYSKGMKGAFVFATTADFQQKQEKYLKELGFEPVGTEKNTNSGNYVTVWIISCRKLDELMDQWTEERKKK